ncbi:MAG: ABC transporter ATP-binding protein [Oligoflexia bacterium]|nr:ABC transporter ATP-binding protein [Oligoflexia bacterium]
MNVLELESIFQKYEDKEVLSDLTFQVEKGELFCILGKSGCGKSTLLHSIAGFTNPYQGSISINGKTVFDKRTNIAPEKRNIGLVFQDFSLFPHLSVKENIEYGLDTKSSADKTKRSCELLELVGLQGFESKFPNELSGGEQQRVAIARALAPSPELILLDEPFSNLDPDKRIHLRAEIKEIFKKAGITSIFITHDQHEAFELADRIGLISAGKFLQIGTPEEIFNSPVNQHVVSFLDNGIIIEDAKKLSELQLMNTPHFFPYHSLSLTHDKAENTLQGKISRKVFQGDHHQYSVMIDTLDLHINTAKQFDLNQSIFVKFDLEKAKKI